MVGAPVRPPKGSMATRNAGSAGEVYTTMQWKPVNRFLVKLAAVNQVARNTLSFRFDRQGERFEFLPGQFITLSLVEPIARETDSNARQFSIASSPEEPWIMVATRIRDSEFKQTLASMKPGDPARIEGPEGHFVFDIPETVRSVFLAGGIGITPFRSMIRYSLDRKTPHPIQLLYANRTAQDAAFLDELNHWANANPRFQLLTPMSQPDAQSPSTPAQRIDAAFLQSTLKPDPQAAYFIAGPQGFVTTMKGLLLDLGIPADRMRRETFAGY
jgi:ferredoxin-NADP reductase